MSFFTRTKTDYQLAPPWCHRTNDVERSTQTGRHHLTSGIMTTDPSCLITEWDRLVKQDKLSLNMLRPSRVNPKSLVATWLEGLHSYNALPFAPPGWEIFCLEDLGNRVSWSPHGVRGFQYRPISKTLPVQWGYHPATQSVGVRNTVVLFSPPNSTLSSTPMAEENVQQAAQEMGNEHWETW